MNTLIQRIQSYVATPAQAQEKITELLVELRHRGLNFDVRQVGEDGQTYFYAESANYPCGHISATGRTMNELEKELKDAIFTAFEVPVRYCNPALIVFNPSLAQHHAVTAGRKVYATT